MRLSRVSTVLLTQSGWRTMGGLPGLMLTINEAVNGFIPGGGESKFIDQTKFPLVVGPPGTVRVQWRGLVGSHC